MRSAERHGREVELFGMEPEPDYGLKAIPAHMLVLANATNASEGCLVVLDTNRGTITLYDHDRDLG